jgi:hypothetical protein
MSDVPITLEEFKEAMPAHIRKAVNTELMDEINQAVMDPEALAVYRENIISFTSVMKEGRFKISSYLSAVKFVSHKLLGDSHIQAWAKTFPQRYNDAVARGTSAGDLASVASRYHSSKLVILLMAQSMMPVHIINRDMFQKALNVQAVLMNTAKSEMVRSNAAANILMTLKPPEAAKVELDIVITEDSSVQALREVTMKLVRQQEKIIENGGASVRSIAESKLIGASDTSEKVIDVNQIP